MSDKRRFTDVVVENEDIEDKCIKCGSALVSTMIPYEGIGSIANRIEYFYCTRCELLYVGGEDDEYYEDDS
jgi:hypothetical protein